MTRITTALLACFIAINAIAKTADCSHIKRTTSNNGTTTYSSPDLKHLRIVKQYSADTFTGILFHFKSEVGVNETKTAILHFDDGTELTNDGLTITVQQHGAMLSGTNDYSASAAYSGGYLISFYFPVPKGSQQLFTSKRLQKVIIERIPFSISKKEAEQTQTYLGCMMSGEVD